MSNYNSSPVVLFFGKPSFLSASLVSGFISKSCFVHIVDDDVASWKRLVDFSNLDKERCDIIDSYSTENIRCDYLIVLKSYFEQKTFSKLVASILSIKKNKDPKAVFVLPFLDTDKNHKKFARRIRSSFGKYDVTSVYIGDVVDDINFTWLTKYNNTNKELFLYPIFARDVVDRVERIIFSFAGSRKVALTGRSINLDDVEKNIDANRNKRLLPDSYLVQAGVDETVVLSTDGKLALDELSRQFEKYKEAIDFSSKNIYKTVESPKTVATREQKQFVKSSILLPLQFSDETNNKISKTDISNRGVVKTDRPKEKLPKLKIEVSRKFLERLKIFYKRLFIAIAFTFVTLVFIPFVLISLNLLLLKMSSSILDSGNTNAIREAFSLTEKSSKLSLKYINLLTKISPVYKKPYDLAKVLSLFSESGKGFIKIKETSSLLVENILDNEPTDIVSLSSSLDIESDGLYRNLGFLESQTKHLSGVNEKIVLSFSKDLDLETERNKLLDLKVFAKSLPELIGVEKQKTYALVIEDNKIAHPSGGKIDAVLLVSFSGGKLVDLQSYSSSYLDGQVKGEVEVPPILRNHFGNKEWSISDAGIEMSYQDAAEKIEWFLDKSINQGVDGTLAITWTAVENVLHELGEVYLPTADVSINSGNLKEVAKEKLANEGASEIFLEDFSRWMVAKYLEKDRVVKDSVNSRIAESLQTKNLIVFVHDTKLQQIVSRNNWGANLEFAECGGNCYEDLVGIVELANQNTDLYDIEKKASLEVSLEKNLIKRKLMLEIKRGVNSPADEYKDYIVVLAKKDVGFENVLIDSRTNERPELVAGKNYKGAGLLVKLKRGETKRIVFAWESGTDLDLYKTGEYKLAIRKQPGIGKYPFSVLYNLRTPGVIKTNESLSLTKEGKFSYNTELDRDEETSIFWKND